MIRALRHRAPAGLPPMEALRYLKRAYPATPEWALRRALKNRDLRVNGARVGAGAGIAGGDEVVLYLEDRHAPPPPRILWQSEEMLAVEKPPGLPVAEDRDGVGADTMLSRVQTLYPQARLAHRLDAGTGGALLLALNENALTRLKKAFAEHRVHKTYRAIVKGVPAPREGEMRDWLYKDAQSAYVRALAPRPFGSGQPLGAARSMDAALPKGAQDSALRYRVLADRGDRSLVQINLITGRTHQIRVQFASRGHPLLGDDKYGDRAFNRRYPAQKTPALWCVGIALGSNLHITSQERFYDGTAP